MRETSGRIGLKRENDPISLGLEGEFLQFVPETLKHPLYTFRMTNLLLLSQILATKFKNLYPRQEQQIWLEMYQMKDLLTCKSHLCLCFCFYQVGLCSFNYIANEYSIYYLCIIIKELSISFSRGIIAQDFKTVTINVLFVYKPTFSVIFL